MADGICAAGTLLAFASIATVGFDLPDAIIEG
jgi:hypothetical protein